MKPVLKLSVCLVLGFLFSPYSASGAQNRRIDHVLFMGEIQHVLMGVEPDIDETELRKANPGMLEITDRGIAFSYKVHPEGVYADSFVLEKSKDIRVAFYHKYAVLAFEYDGKTCLFYRKNGFDHFTRMHLLRVFSGRQE